MPFQLSPGVAVVEKDFSSIVPAVSSSAGAFAGPFAWGPVEDPVRVSSETDLVSRFGGPTNDNYSSFFTAANFLAYTNNLFVSRSDATGLRNAVDVQSGGVVQADITLTSAGSGYITADTVTVTFSAPQLAGGVAATGTVAFTGDGTVGALKVITGITLVSAGSGYTSAPTITISAPITPGTTATATLSKLTLSAVKIKNIENYLSGFSAGNGIYGMFAAKFPGQRGNGIKVLVVDAGNWSALTTLEQTAFNGAPGTSSWGLSNGITNDELHIAIYDTPFGDFSGTANSLLEKYSFVSKLSDAKRTDGSNNYYKSVINSQSKYVWSLAHPTLVSEPTSNAVITASSIVFNKAAATIVSADPTQFAQLAAFKVFFDSAVDKTTRQITVSYSTGTGINNGSFTVASIVPTPLTGTATSYTITVVGDVLLNETNAYTNIVSTVKAPWGLTSTLTKSIAGADTIKVLKEDVLSTLSGGVNDFSSTAGNVQNAYAPYANADEYDISLIPAGNVDTTTAKWILDNVVEVRKDCVLFISPRLTPSAVYGEPVISTGSTATAALVAYKVACNINSSYAVMDSGFKYQYDRYNDAYRWVPLNGDIAGLCARTDYSADPWFSPGGVNRGQIKNVIKLGFNPGQADRDVLYAAGINPVVTFPGQGTILYGDKTMLTKPSAFDRINVRRLFIVLEKSISVAAKYQMFEFNDGFTRAQFKNLVEPFLRDVKGRRGVTDFRVKCDEANNTGEVIDRNEFVADIFIKPNRSINYITLNFIAARSSVSFEEIGA